MFVDYGVAADQNDPPVSYLEIDTNALSIGIDDYYETAYGCPDRSSMAVCISAPLLTFSMPQGRIDVGQTWRYEGWDFSVVSNDTLRLIGTTTPVLRIVSKNNALPPRTFYYSRKEGLLAIIIPTGYLGTASAYMAVGAHGPFSEESK